MNARLNFSLRVALLVSALLLSCASALRATMIIDDYTWTGNGTSNDWYDSDNWAGGVVPDNYFTANVIFGDTNKNYIRLYIYPDYYSINAYGLTFNGNTRPYFLDGNYDGYLSVNLGAGGISYNPAQPVSSTIAADVNLQDNQIWNIQSGTFVIQGQVDDDDSYTLTKAGAGTLVLNQADNYFYQGIYLNNGRLVLSASSYYYSGPLGSADLTIGPASVGINPILVANDNNNDNSVILDNHVILNGTLATENHTELHLAGPVTLNDDTVVQTKGRPLFLDGNITDWDPETELTRGFSLTLNSPGVLVLSGYNDYSGGTTATKGIIVFTSENSVPSVGSLTAASEGYIGRMFDPAGESVLMPDYLNKFDKTNTSGTIGFDTDPEEGGLNDFTDNINLTGFNATARLGSATQAIISGTITPQGADYRFGGGGGVLTVASKLTGAHNVVADSPAELPLTVRLLNTTNDFTGTVTVNNSALIFADDIPLPAGTYSMNSHSYIGTEDPDVTAATFLTHFSATTQGVIGFDLSPSSMTTREISDLALPGYTGGVYVGTTSALYDEAGDINGPGLRLTGSIGPNSDGVHRFAAYKGGALEVAGTLTGNAVIIGHPDSLGAFGDRNREQYSIVLLSGNNTGGLAGGVTFYGGHLMLGQGTGTIGEAPSTVLGDALLTVAPVNFTLDDDNEGAEAPTGLLSVSENNIIIPNDIFLQTELNVGGDNDFTLAGSITGSGELYVGEDSDCGFTLSLTGENTFGGGVYVAQGATVNAGSNTALGIGPVGFGYSGGTINFLTTAPVIGSLMTKDESDYAYLYATQSNTALKINQSIDGRFRGEIRTNATSPNDNLRVVKDGSATLLLDSGGLYFYRGTTEPTLGPAEAHPQVSLQVNQGTLVLGSDFNIWETASNNPLADPPLTPTTIWVHGGTLALERNPYDDDKWVNNPIVVDNGGRLAGNGAFNSNVSIGAGAILSPGLSGMGNTGMLAFDHLELNSGGIYEWQVQNPTAEGQAGRDLINVGLEEPIGTLVVNAGTTLDNPATLEINEDTRFTLKVISLGMDGANGLLNGFDPSQPYVWSIFSYDALSGFDPAKFNIDTSEFANSLAFDERGNGNFYLTASDGHILLGFNPVPEPSTYALMALGLGLIGLTVWRRRRA